MTESEFKKLSLGELVQPNYSEYSKNGFTIKSINLREGLIEVNEKRYLTDTMWYRYENLSRVTYCKMLDKNTLEEIGYQTL